MTRLNNKGITLIELLIGMTILSVVSLMVASLMGSASRMYRSTVTYADIQTESQTVSRRLGTAIMNASSVYMEESGEGTFLFTGERLQEGGRVSYSGLLFWFNKETGCLYQNSSFYAEEELAEAGGAAMQGEKGMLTNDTIKAAIELGASQGKEFLISNKIKDLQFTITPELKAEEQIEGGYFYLVNGTVTLNYAITLNHLDARDYEISSSATPRNQLAALWWKELETDIEEEIAEKP